MSKTLEEQFKNTKLPPERRPSFIECQRINNYQALHIIRYIIMNECKLEHRKSLESDDWEPGTMREFLYWYTQAGIGRDKKVDQFDSWMLNFWRIKTTPTEEEKYKLTHINNQLED